MTIYERIEVKGKRNILKNWGENEKMKNKKEQKRNRFEERKKDMVDHRKRRK